MPQALAHPLGMSLGLSKPSSRYKGRRVHRGRRAGLLRASQVQCQAGHLRAGQVQCQAGRVHLAGTPPKYTFNIAHASNSKRPRSKVRWRTHRRGNEKECGASFEKFDTGSDTTAGDSGGNAAAPPVGPGTSSGDRGGNKRERLISRGLSANRVPIRGLSRRSVMLSRCRRLCGEVPERSNGAVSKTVVPLAGDRGFESLPLRRRGGSH